MIRVRQVKVPISSKDIKKRVSAKIKVSEEEILSLKINKKSIDARDKNNIYFVYEVDICLKDEDKVLKRKNRDVLKTTLEKYSFNNFGSEKITNRPVIIGAGPAGLFCGYLLALNGYKPIIIERGEKIESRVKTVDKFWKDGVLNENSNVQFGEGGAGTFSDGKLNTLVKDKNYRMKKVFEMFVEFGAPEEILYLNKPHIGTDLLRDVIINMRKEIISLGGEFRYNCLMSDINFSDRINNVVLDTGEKILCDALVLAIGHSSRDTFEMLYDRKINMEAKPFAVGVRVQHSQKLINKALYGQAILPPASYKLTYKAKNGRGVYSFCMCPGGYVVNASSEKGKLAINGMSNHDRDSGVANSAIIVTVSKDDFGDHPLGGMRFQRDLERQVFDLTSGRILVQLYGDYKNGNVSKSIDEDKVRFKGDYALGDINKVFPSYINDSIKEGMEHFAKIIEGFNNETVVLSALESRTSSPVRIIRDDNFEANIKGIYPCGEGAGYAGGITTSAMDGIKVAEAIMSKYAPFD